MATKSTDWLAGHGDDIAGNDITLLIDPGPAQTSRIRRRTRFDLEQQDAFDAKLLGERPIDIRIDADTEARAYVLSARDELRHYPVHSIHRDRESDPGIGAGGAVDRGVYTYQTAGAVQQRSAGITRVDRCIGLNQVCYGDAVVFS